MMLRNTDTMNQVREKVRPRKQHNQERQEMNLLACILDSRGESLPKLRSKRMSFEDFVMFFSIFCGRSERSKVFSPCFTSWWDRCNGRRMTSVSLYVCCSSEVACRWAETKDGPRLGHSCGMTAPWDTQGRTCFSNLESCINAVCAPPPH